MAKIVPIKVNRVFTQKREIENGLMFIKKLPLDSGALFCMPEEKIHKFWMKNTYVSLDVIFLDDNFRIVGFVENTTPLDVNLIYVGHTSKYVIEIKAGYIRKKGIDVDDYFTIKWTNKKTRRNHKNNTKKILKHNL